MSSPEAWMKCRGQSAHLNLTRGRAFPPRMYETPQPDPGLHSLLVHDQISQENTHELLTRLRKREDSCGNGSAVLLHFRESIKFLIPLDKMTWPVKKQAFFLKCSQLPQFPIESKLLPHFSFPHNSLVVSLSKRTVDP